MIENIQKYPIRFIQYAALVGSLYALAQGNFILATGLFAFALCLEKMLAKLCFSNGYGTPESISFSNALTTDGFSYPSQLFGLFTDGATTGVRAIKDCFKKNEPDVEAAKQSPAQR